jgi:O-glycosyl hydrolase
MLWGTKQISDFTRLVKPGYARYALGFNEPDHAGQANLDPGNAASIWQQHMQPLKGQGYSLVSPAVTSGSSGKPWLQSFLKSCSGCNVDYISVHWYGTDPQQFIKYCEDFHTTFGKDLWVTEFACQNFSGGAQCTESQVQNFMSTVTAWMDSTPYIAKYFAFGVMVNMQGVNPLNQLMGANGQPTALGWSYLT